MSGLDALVYSQLKNNIKDDRAQKWGGHKYETNRQLFDKMEDVIKHTTIKRACCMKKQAETAGDMYVINVNIPVPKDLNWDGDDAPTKVGIKKKYGFITKKVNVPKSMCNSEMLGGDYQPGQDTCNDFYDIYCMNIKDFFMKENGGVWNEAEWPDYKPDCACYGKMPDYIDPEKGAVPPKCLLAGCDEGNDNGYLDPLSRADECNNTICVQNVDFSKLDVGRDANINTKLQNTCGGQLAERQQQQMSGTEPSSNNTSSNNTSSGSTSTNNNTTSGGTNSGNNTSGGTTTAGGNTSDGGTSGGSTSGGGTSDGSSNNTTTTSSSDSDSGDDYTNMMLMAGGGLLLVIIIIVVVCIFIKKK